MEKIGIFGGTFNPIHYGHLRAAEEARELMGFSRMLFVPAANPPLKSSAVAPAAFRYEMVRLAVAGNPFFEVTDIECRREGNSYTVDTLRELAAVFPSAELWFIVGIDSFLDMPHWHQPDQLFLLANFVVISRPGYSFESLAPLVPLEPALLRSLDRGETGRLEAAWPAGKRVALLRILPVQTSATAIRALIAAERSVKYLLPEAVESFIIAENLYREGVKSFRKQG